MAQPAAPTSASVLRKMELILLSRICRPLAANEDPGDLATCRDDLELKTGRGQIRSRRSSIASSTCIWCWSKVLQRISSAATMALKAPRPWGEVRGKWASPRLKFLNRIGLRPMAAKSGQRLGDGLNSGRGVPLRQSPSSLPAPPQIRIKGPMGNVVKFRRAPRNRGQFRGQGRWRPEKGPGEPGRRKPPDTVGLLLALVALLSLAGLWWNLDAARAEPFACQSVSVTDGDTFECDGKRIRMVGIDAPELPGHCRPGRECTPGDPWASTENLRRRFTDGPVECRRTDTDAYGRTVARCKAGETDLSCAQIRDGFAVRRYRLIWC